MIVLFSDFGLTGPYIGQVKAVLYQHAPQVHVIDLFSDAPVHNPKASAYLLASYAKGFPQDTVFLAVVDPGVGTAQRLPVIVNADGHWFVGPDNGLFNVIAGHAQQIEAWHVSWPPAGLSASFHGRDLFAPLAADLSLGVLPSDEYLHPLQLTAWGEELTEIIYVDHFGNLMTGIRANSVNDTTSLVIDGIRGERVRTFGEVAVGKPLCYENANGLLELAVNQGRADVYFNASIGTPVQINSVL